MSNWNPGPAGSKARKETKGITYLDPAHKKYPYGTVGHPSKEGLKAAISVANAQGDKTIAAKASAKLAKLNAK